MKKAKIILGLFIFLAGFAMVLNCGFLIYQNETENAAIQQAQELELPKLKKKIMEETGNPENKLYQRWLLGDAYIEPDTISTEEDSQSVIPLDGYSYIGYLTFPTLGTELPVIDGWDSAKLKKGPCRYYGSAETGDLVIAAHNYRSSFGQCKQLRVGDEILFTNTAGIVRHYLVGEVEIVGPSAVDYMINSDWELSLYTCTYGGKQRLTIRCAEQKELSEAL